MSFDLDELCGRCLVLYGVLMAALSTGHIDEVALYNVAFALKEIYLEVRDAFLIDGEVNPILQSIDAQLEGNGGDPCAYISDYYLVIFVLVGEGLVDKDLAIRANNIIIKAIQKAKLSIVREEISSQDPILQDTIWFSKN